MSGFGAYAWMAPEQLAVSNTSGTFSFSQRSDVFSFGVLLFEIFEQRFPWDHVEKRGEVIKNIISGTHLPLEHRLYPPGLSHYIMSRIWRKNPDERPTMEEVVAQLKMVNRAVLASSNAAPPPAFGAAPPPAGDVYDEPSAQQPLTFVGGAEQTEIYDEPLSFQPE